MLPLGREFTDESVSKIEINVLEAVKIKNPFCSMQSYENL